MTSIWPPTREAGLERLTAFLPKAGRTYAKRRNFDLGPGRHEGVSGLSPYLRHRLLTEEEVVDAVLAKHAFGAAEKFIQEVFWRTYWKGWLERRPGVWREYKQELTYHTDRLDENIGLRQRYEEAISGRTGTPCFDAWVSELITTGYLHNHARMWFASLWIFTLDLPWELGADFFLAHLLDGDPASNTLSWRWVGGLQTRGKTYLARADNIHTYTEGRFGAVHLPPVDATALEGPMPPPAGPTPEGDAWDRSLPSLLLLTPDDLHPESALGSMDGCIAAAFLKSEKNDTFCKKHQILQDFADTGGTAVLERLGLPGSPSLDPDAETWTDALIDLARSHGAKQIVTPYAPVGATADRLDQLAARLAETDLRLVRVLRPWDARAWAFTTKGFFPFKEKIPQLLSHRSAGAAA